MVLLTSRHCYGQEMTDIDIKLPVTLDANAVVAIVEETCTNETLQITMKSTLKKYPGCVHWHLKKHDERGILEVTWWPRMQEKKPSRLWLSVHGNRSADWILQLMPRMKTLIEEQMAV